MRENIPTESLVARSQVVNPVRSEPGKDSRTHSALGYALMPDLEQEKQPLGESGPSPAQDQPEQEVTEREGVEDLNPEAPEEELPVVYTVTAYGADYPVDALVSRITQEDIVVPEFQRGFIWPRSRIDRFVESLLLGLPVPGIFLANEPETNRLMVIDGQQRLMTLWSFYRGRLRGKEFTLGKGVQEQFQGKSYEDLEEEDRRRLDNSIIHATVIRQDQPSDDQSSIYFVFERLNTGGTILQPQEIRAAIYGGEFNDFLHQINEYPRWRDVFGKKSSRRKDQELILRFFAFRHHGSEYRRPMKEFLNDFMGKNRHLVDLDRAAMQAEFEGVIDLLADAIPAGNLFRPGGKAMNAAVFDAMTVGVAPLLQEADKPKSDCLRQAYLGLLEDEDFQMSYQRATADEASVERRIRMATEAFAAV